MMLGNAMVVEDQPNFRRGLVRMIEESEYKWTVVGEAGNGQDALQVLDRYQPDLVLTDIRMPVMDGIEFLTHLRQRYPHTLVIILTGFRSFEYAQAAIKLGALDYLVKPCTEEDVTRVLRIASERFESQRPAPQLPADSDTFKSDHVIDKAIAYVEAHYAEECRMTDTAAHIHLNPSYFSVLFKKTTGESYTGYVTRYRMEKAMTLLKTTDMRIFEIAAATGFDEPNYFTNVFKQYYQASPKEFRKAQA